MSRDRFCRLFFCFLACSKGHKKQSHETNENGPKLSIALHHFAANEYITLRPWAIGENYFIWWHPSEKHLVYGLFERLIGTVLPKKVPKPKTCPIPRKRLICDYLVLNCITAKKREIFKSTITKMTCTMK